MEPVPCVIRLSVLIGKLWVSLACPMGQAPLAFFSAHPVHVSTALRTYVFLENT